MAFSQQVYSDFSGGFNDTSAAISIEDNQFILSENADYAANVKALQTRKGCIKVNNNSYGYEVTDGFGWQVGSVYKKCIVMNNTVYELNTETGAITSKIALKNGATKIYPFVYYNKMFFGDGSEIYVWGDWDYTTDSADKVDIQNNEIVKYMEATNSKGDYGHFYKYLGITTPSQGQFNFKEENYKNTAEWKDVTDVVSYSSDTIKPVKAFDPSKAEVVLVSVLSGATKTATIKLTLGTTTTSISISASDSVSNIVDKIAATSITGWTSKKDSNAVRFTATDKGAKEAGYLDPADSGATFTYKTEVEGKANDCHMDEIRKCTLFCVHQGSYRVFAAGNPDDNSALYFSEIGYPNYFDDKLSVVYPSINGYGSVTAMMNLSDALIVSYESGWYSWTGTTPLSDAYWKPLNIPYGCISSRTLCMTPNSFTFLSKVGIYNVRAGILNIDAILLQGQSLIQKISENVVEKTIDGISDKRICEAIFYDNVYYLAYNTDGVSNQFVLKYEWDTSSFTKVTGWKVNRFIGDPDELYFTTRNYVLNALHGYSDVNIDTGEKQPIHLHVKSKEYHLGTPISQKNLQHIGFIFQQHSFLENNDLLVESGITLTLYAGYRKFNIDAKTLAESLIYGRTWGKIWGFREAIVQMAEIILQSNTFQVEIENNDLDNPITLIGIGFVYEVIDIVTPTILKDEVLLK